MSVQYLVTGPVLDWTVLTVTLCLSQKKGIGAKKFSKLTGGLMYSLTTVFFMIFGLKHSHRRLLDVVIKRTIHGQMKRISTREGIRKMFEGIRESLYTIEGF